MNIQKIINAIIAIEADGAYAPDFRRTMRDERMVIMVRHRAKDVAGAQAAAKEALRVAELWGVKIEA